MPYRLRTPPPVVQAIALAALVVAMVLIAVVSGGGRWAALRPPIRSRIIDIANELKPVEEQLKRRDKEIEDLTEGAKR